MSFIVCFSWVPVYTDKDQRLAVMSIGFLLNSRDDAVVWRGPKKNGIFYISSLYVLCSVLLLLSCTSKEIIHLGFLENQTSSCIIYQLVVMRFLYRFDC